MSILESLNDQQKEAACSIDGAILILAGAGSGKTKTITTRLAYLIEEVGIPADQTLTLTFTNKAAGEMRMRATHMITNPYQHPLLCTFHRFGLLFLKLYISELRRSNNFIVIDASDQKKIVHDLSSSLSIKTKQTDSYAYEISRFKNTLLTPEELLQENIKPDSDKADAIAIYQAYEQYLKTNNLVDFDDLLLLPYQILDQSKDLAKEVSKRYAYIMVDEYQDTNKLQNELLSKLLTSHQNLCAVGDDDQSIYSWRGADIDYILNFQNHFKFENVKMVRLEQNYRSTAEILDAANKVIMHNKNRLGKTLVSTFGSGEKIHLLNSIDDCMEINQIANKITKLIHQGVAPQDIAILFRLNAFTRSIEEGLTRAKIPFKLIGAIRFYERKEIKDYIAYLRLMINLHDDFSLAMIIDRPRRGIGQTSLQKILKKAQELGFTSIYQFMQNEESRVLLGNKKAKILQDLFATLEELKTNLEISVLDFMTAFEKTIGLKRFYAEHEDGEERIANIDELLGVIGRIASLNPELSLEEITNELSLNSASDDIMGDNIFCMSVHNSKGLEFEHVFVIGLEEGFFPLLKTGSDLEEERRLSYVAFTRAKKSLTLSYTTSRFFRGKKMILEPSRFLIEAGLLHQSFQDKSTESQFKENDLVRHNIFGAGYIKEIIHTDQNMKLKINFGGLEREILAQFVAKII